MRTFVISISLLALGALAAAPRAALPRFTEEREAAALHFVKKQLPELIPLLADLKRSNQARYQQEISEIFQVTELLADLQDEPKRHDLELKVWKTENRAAVLIARMRSSSEEDRKRVQDQLRDLARELVDLDIQVLESQVAELEKDLTAVKDDLGRARAQVEQNTKAKFESLLEKAKKPR